jgi:DNA primase
MDAVEDVKARLSIEDVVSRYVELKRAGRNFKGLSPFGNEKTPSFMVSPEKQIWHDFSSGKGGTMFSFIMEMEGVDFRGALEILARQAGIDLAMYQTGSSSSSKLKSRVYEALELATKFYQIQFSKYRPAAEYILKKRQFSKSTALEFRIGYAPESGSSLTNFMLGKGFTKEELKAAGLGTQRREFGDMFRGRVMFPLADPQGRVIGFTARQMHDDPNSPKYINTPQTMVYDKSRHVYGLHLAKDAIRKSKFAVVVEGNLDVIASHQASIKQTVATAGTAITEMHLKALGRFTPDVRLAFDQDGAGIAAAERAIPLANRADVTLKIIDIPGGKDPDELISKDPAAWVKALESGQYAPDWLINQYQKRLDLTSAVGKREFSDVLLRIVRSMTDSVEQDHYLNKIADLIGVSVDALREKLKKGPSDVRPTSAKRPNQAAPLDPYQVERIKTQNHFLSLMLLLPDSRELIKPILPEMLTEQPVRLLLKFLEDNPSYILTDKNLAPPKEILDFVKMLVLLYEELYLGLENLELRLEATRLQTRLIDYYVKTKKSELAEQMRDAGNDQTDTLLKEVKELDILLNNSKEKTNGR